MPKKTTLVIYASPKPMSYTFKLMQYILGKKEDVKIFNCFEQMPHPCTDCGLCKNINACRYDDLDVFFDDFEKAEEIIFAFPVYNCSVPAPLKALIDRFQRFYNARFFQNKRPPISGKRNVNVAMTFGGNNDDSETVLKQLTPLFSISGCNLDKCYILKNTDKLLPGDSIIPYIIEKQEKL